MLLVSHVLIVQRLGRQLLLELLYEGSNHGVIVVLQKEAVRLIHLTGEDGTGVRLDMSLCVCILDIRELIDRHLAHLSFHGIRVEIENAWLRNHVNTGIFWIVSGGLIRTVLKGQHLFCFNVRDHRNEVGEANGIVSG